VAIEESSSHSIEIPYVPSSMRTFNRNGWFTVAKCLGGFWLLILLTHSLYADWPTYRGDNHRSASSAEKISPQLHLQWVFHPRHAPKTAWPLPGEETPRMHSDRAHHVVEADGLAYFGSTVDHHVYALDSNSGEIRWRFATSGAIRFAPVAWEGGLYVGSDDGYAYCLDAKTGDLRWKYRPSPADEHVVGMGRMVSLWPLRTGLLVENGVVYLTAGIFPYEGLYVSAVNAHTGEEIWKNDTAGDLSWGLDYGGMAPQGYLLGSATVLYVPSGRGMPAAFERATGKFLRFLSTGGKIGGSWALVDPAKNQLIAGVNNQGTPAKIAYDNATGSRKGDIFASFPGIDMVLTAEKAFTLTENAIVSINRRAYREAAVESPKIGAERKELAKKIEEIRNQTKEFKAKIAELNKPTEEGSTKPKLVDPAAQIAELETQIKLLRPDLTKATVRLTEITDREKILKADRVHWEHKTDRLSTLVHGDGAIFGGGDGVVVAIDETSGESKWEQDVDGQVLGMGISNGKLFVSTDEGPIYCFGESEPASTVEIRQPQPIAYPENPKVAATAKAILNSSGVDKGFCLISGAGEGELAYEIAKRSNLQIVGIERDPAKLRRARQRLDKAGLYGSRVSIESWEDAELPDYFANLIVATGSEPPSDDLSRMLRPAGGVIVFNDTKVPFTSGVSEPQPIANTNLFMLTRPKLEKSGDWSGLYGNVSNTGSSPDENVRGPFGVLWFGEPGSEHMLDRHARSVSPLSVNGRLLVQGMEVAMGFDAYNGTFLWRREIPGAVRARVDVDGSNITATDDAMFVAAFDKVHMLDAQTGQTIREFQMPKRTDRIPRRWGYIGVSDGILYGSAAMPLKYEYGQIWRTWALEGKWIPREEVPEDFKEGYDKIVKSYPEPNDDAHDYFKRAGIHWKYSTTFPGWLPDHKPSPVNEKIMVSDALFAFDTSTGEQLWIHQGRNIPSITITLGDGRIFFLQDDLSDDEKKMALEDRENMIKDGVYDAHKEGELPEDKRDLRRVVALDARTGIPLWSKPSDLSGAGGTKLGTAYHDGRLLFFGHYSNHDEGPFSKGDLAWRRITTMSGASGSVEWSKPLNYRRRPLIMGEKIFIEPRAASLYSGEIINRKHPITGKSVEWEFLRPGHSCGIVTASPSSIFYRSFSAAIVDVENDTGLQLFGGMRPGCWNNLIPGNGVLTMQEASAGCTCSYALRTTVVLKTKKQKGPGEWSVFISNAPSLPVSHLAVNFGAPGDMRDAAGTLWFGYPRPDTRAGQGSFKDYGIKFDLKQNEGTSVAQRDFRGVEIEGATRPWLYTTALHGFTKCEVPLLEAKSEPASFSVKLGFATETGDLPGERVFDIKLQGKIVATGFDPAKDAGKPEKAVVLEFDDIQVAENLTVELVPTKEKPKPNESPKINFLEVVRNDAGN
jgi:outer membrane protein assembly factor BamB